MSNEPSRFVKNLSEDGVSAIVFDADGVVVDTLSLAMQAQHEILALLGVDVHIRNRQDMKREFGDASLNNRYGEKGAFTVKTLHPLVMRQRLIEAGDQTFRAVVDVVCQRGRKPTIVTASFAEGISSALGPHRRCFGSILGRELGRKIDLMQQLKDEIGRYVYVCDTTRDVERCLQVDVPSVGVAWGYDAEADLRAAGCTSTLREPAELHSLYDRWTEDQAQLAVRNRPDSESVDCVTKVI